MNNEPPDRRPPDFPEETDPDLVDAEELDDVLAAASSLATELSGELGAADTGPSSANPSPNARPRDGVDDSTSASLDAELSDLQGLISTASDEINGGSDAITDKGEPRGDVPDFMAEFTRPGPEESRLETENVNNSPSLPGASTNQMDHEDSTPDLTRTLRPGVVGTGMIGSIASGKDASDKERAAAESPEESSETGADESTDRVEVSKRIARTATTRLRPVAVGLALRGVRLLERLDGPVSGVAASVRRAIGLMAIATLGTAVIVYLVSLF